MRCLVSTFGGVVNCGGFGGEIATPMDTDIAVFDKVIGINARGALLVIKHASQGVDGVDAPDGIYVPEWRC